MEQIELLKITIPQDKAYLVDEHVKTFASIVGDMTTLYAKKNHDYGNSFDEGCDKIGVGYPLGRLLDKMNRLIACMGKYLDPIIEVNRCLTCLAVQNTFTCKYKIKK